MPVINTTTGTAGNVGSTAATLLNDLRMEFLEVVSFRNKLEAVFQKVSTDGKTVQWNRMEKLSVAATPAQLSEGVNPDPVGLSINQVTATMEEYGLRTQISRMAKVTAKNDIIAGARETVAMHAAEVREQLLYNVANAATNIFRVNDRATDNALAVGDHMSCEEISQMRSALAAAGVPRWENGNFKLVLPSHLYTSIMNDPTWLANRNESRSTDMDRGYVGTIYNVDVIEDDNGNAFSATASTTNGNSSKIYTGVLAGRGFAKVTDLETVDFVMRAPGQGDDTLKLRWEIGYYMSLKAKITNENFGRKVRASGDDATAV